LVTSLQNNLRGIISLNDVENYLQKNSSGEWVTAARLMRTQIPLITPDVGLTRALEAFKHFDGERLPVVKDTLE